METLAKTPTGITGFDEITFGGLPAGRPSLICGRAGAGKTLFAMTFLVKGAVQFNEPGVFMSFEETADDLAQNVASLGFDVAGLVAANKLAMDYVRIERSEIEETGDYDLEGLFVRLDYAIRSVGAKRVVLDTLEALFGGLAERRRAARGVAAPVRLAEGAGRHRADHGRAGRRHAHPSWPGGIRLRLRDPARQPGAEPDSPHGACGW